MSRPVESFTYPAGQGSQIEIAVWENEQEKKGQTFLTHSVSIQRRYKDGDEWKTASGFRPSDLLTVAHGMHEAFQYIINVRSKK